MAAANTDKFKKSAPRKQSTTTASMSTAADTSIVCDSLSAWPTDTAVEVTFNRVDENGDKQGTWETATAVVSSNTLTNMVRGNEGTASAWASGTVVELLNTAQQQNDMVDGILVHSNQDGTLKDDSVDSDQIVDGAIDLAHMSANSVDSDQYVDGSIDNAHLAANSVDSDNYVDGSIDQEHLASGIVSNAKLDTTQGELGGEWDDWVPSWTGVTVSNSTVVAKYTQIGKTVHFYIHLTLAGGDAPSSNVSTDLPVNAHGDYPTDGAVWVGSGSVVDSGTEIYALVANISAADTLAFRVIDQTGSYIGTKFVNGSVPITWANGDAIYVQGTYEAA